MPIQFRPATPNDVTAAVPLIYSSGPAAFEYVFAHKTKGSAQDFLHYAFTDGAGEFGYINHTVVILDNTIVGIGTAFSGDTALTFMLAAVRQIVTFYGLLHAPAIIVRGLRIERIVQPPKKGIHYIAHLGIAPELRSRGIGAQLVAHLLEQAIPLGRTRAALDVAVTNPRAQALYERLGFTVIHECPSNLHNQFGTVGNHRRMEKPIP